MSRGSAASLDEVLQQWQGLGYYARARNLHRAARVIAVAGFPRDYAGWLALPGVGPYTAAAISSLALGEKRAVSDGNVRRVLARLWGERQPTGLAVLDDEARLVHVSAVRTDEQIRAALEPWLGPDCVAGIDAPLRAGRRHVVMGWPIAQDGRKLHAGTAIVDADGRVVARSLQLWLLPRSD